MLGSSQCSPSGPARVTVAPARPVKIALQVSIAIRAKGNLLEYALLALSTLSRPTQTVYQNVMCVLLAPLASSQILGLPRAILPAAHAHGILPQFLG